MAFNSVKKSMMDDNKLLYYKLLLKTLFHPLPLNCFRFPYIDISRPRDPDQFSFTV